MVITPYKQAIEMSGVKTALALMPEVLLVLEVYIKASMVGLRG